MIVVHKHIINPEELLKFAKEEEKLGYVIQFPPGKVCQNCGKMVAIFVPEGSYLENLE